jgi:hypothetical protein
MCGSRPKADVDACARIGLEALSQRASTSALTRSINFFPVGRRFDPADDSLRCREHRPFCPWALVADGHVKQMEAGDNEGDELGSNERHECRRDRSRCCYALLSVVARSAPTRVQLSAPTNL